MIVLPSVRVLVISGGLLLEKGVVGASAYWRTNFEQRNKPRWGSSYDDAHGPYESHN